jgi:hypothetical protein
MRTSVREGRTLPVNDDVVSAVFIADFFAENKDNNRLIKREPNNFLKTKPPVHCGGYNKVKIFTHNTAKNQSMTFLDEVLEKKYDIALFRLSDGTQPKSFHTTFIWLMKASGLLKDSATNQNRTLYSLRHTYATLAMTEGNMDMHTLAKQMGTSVGMLERHYSKLTATMAAERLAK